MNLASRKNTNEIGNCLISEKFLKRFPTTELFVIPDYYWKGQAIIRTYTEDPTETAERRKGQTLAIEELQKTMPTKTTFPDFIWTLSSSCSAVMGRNSVTSNMFKRRDEVLREAYFGAKTHFYFNGAFDIKNGITKLTLEGHASETKRKITNPDSKAERLIKEIHGENAK